MSPSDRDKIDAVAWLERLQASVQHAGSSKGLESFSLGSRVGQDAEEDEEEGEEGAGREGGSERPSLLSHNKSPEDQVPLKDANDKLHSLPDDAVPLGLLANLSLSNSRSKKARQKPASNENDNTDDDDVVRLFFFFLLSSRDVTTSLG